jgi:hypothetical protein
LEHAVMSLLMRMLDCMPGECCPGAERGVPLPAARPPLAALVWPGWLKRLLQGGGERQPHQSEIPTQWAWSLSYRHLLRHGGASQQQHDMCVLCPWQHPSPIH